MQLQTNNQDSTIKDISSVLVYSNSGKPIAFVKESPGGDVYLSTASDPDFNLQLQLLGLEPIEQAQIKLK